MTAEEHHHQRIRHARFRRVKFLLRFVPRRAVMHRYPLIGRFAHVARRVHYLWSFRTEHVRPAFYAGSVLSFMPLVGVQMPLALLLSILLRCNFMVTGGLQLITNFVTAVPIYYGTYELGEAVLHHTGLVSAAPDEPTSPPSPSGPHSVAANGQEAPATGPLPAHHKWWSRKFGQRINALIVGGVIVGLATGAVLDVAWRYGAKQATAYRARHPRPKRVEEQEPTDGSDIPPPDAQAPPPEDDRAPPEHN